MHWVYLETVGTCLHNKYTCDKTSDGDVLPASFNIQCLPYGQSMSEWQIADHILGYYDQEASP